jgi:Cytochrome c554 and c-prime
MRKRNIRSIHIVIAASSIALLLLVSTCKFTDNENKLSGVVHSSGQEFAGSETCVKCHQSIAESHSITPHFLTSRPGTAETVRGSFDSGKNVFALNERLKVVMEKTPSGLFQRAFVADVEVDKKPMDITLGSGRQGQTYLFWLDSSLFQLPVSYHAPSGSWSNSPGYPTDQILFNRSISARCLECHSTYFKIGKTINGNETFDKGQVMLGVDCERCHGPAARHVNFHTRNPQETEAQHIINPTRLDRKQKLDNCALCHSGIRNTFKPSFSYLVGDNLDEFLFPTPAADSGATLDVHGNQLGLLKLSKCFRMSTMDCSSCHNVHEKETKKLQVFSARCMNCHKEGGDNFCTQPEVSGLVLSKNCIDCHMPALPSRQVFLRSSDHKSTPFFIRTHLVGNYEKQIKLFLEKITSETSAAK